MALELSYPHIEKPRDEPARLQRIPRTRVSQVVMAQLAHGWSAEEICRHYPYLLPAEVYAALGYYSDHSEEIDDEIRREWESLRPKSSDTEPRSPFFTRMRAKGLL